MHLSFEIYEEEVLRIVIKHTDGAHNKESPLFVPWSKWIEMQRYAFATEALAVTNGQNPPSKILLCKFKQLQEHFCCAVPLHVYVYVLAYVQ